MVVIGNVHAEYDNQPSCGCRVSAIGKEGAWSFEYRCRSWRCFRGVCNEALKRDYCVRISLDFGTPLVHVFFARHPERGAPLSKWVKKNVRGSYWRISSDSDTVIMSDRSFPGAVRLHRSKLRQFVEAELGRPWSRKGRRVSSSRRFKPAPKQEKDSKAYAWIPSEREREFSELASDYGRARWLFHNHGALIRKFKAGDQLLKEYRVFWPTWEAEILPGTSFSDQEKVSIKDENADPVIGFASAMSSGDDDLRLSLKHSATDVGLIEKLCRLSVDRSMSDADFAICVFGSLPCRLPQPSTDNMRLPNGLVRRIYCSNAERRR